MKILEHNLHYVEKEWGYEKWIHNSELYCGKELCLYGGSTGVKGTSWHYHELKTETMYVTEGMCHLMYGKHWDYHSKEVKVAVLSPGDSFHIEPRLIHKITNIGNADLKLFEFSTQHFDDDSYRIKEYQDISYQAKDRIQKLFKKQYVPEYVSVEPPLWRDYLYVDKLEEQDRVLMQLRNYKFA